MAFWQSHDNYADNTSEYTECHFRFAGQYEDKESGCITIAFATMIRTPGNIFHLTLSDY